MGGGLILKRRQLAAVVQGEGAFLTVFAHNAPVFEQDADVAQNRTGDGERAGGEHRYLGLVGVAGCKDGIFTIRRYIRYLPRI